MIAATKTVQKSVDRFIARQPIFDRRRDVFGYELLFRASPENFFPQGDGDLASSTLIKDSLLLFGLDAITGDKRAFINVTRQMLVSDSAAVLPCERTVLEILETIEPDEEVILATKRLKDNGYTIALDDFAYRPEFEGLLDLADIVKVDFLATASAQRERLASHFRRRDLRLLAEKVETSEDLQEALDLGYSYFQGYFFCKPQVISRKEVPGLWGNYLKVLSLLNRPDTDFDELEHTIKHEVALSLKLLHYLNSANFGWRNRISSIKQALVLLGTINLRKWASVVAFSSFCENKPKELLTTSLCRARFCELLAPLCGLGQRQLDLFLIGLLSVLDVAMDRSIVEVLQDLSLSADISDALLGGESPLGKLYSLVLAYERGNWERVTSLAHDLGISSADIVGLYCQSIQWADEVNSERPPK
ncbi:MAG TPA: HDOD domain-containing protein [Gemmataceae bacterium]|nr:HDOD domain-containing protein [Gemmataceae bacterium]